MAPVFGGNMHILHSNPLNRFKLEIGQSNHMLITAMIGLDLISASSSKSNNNLNVAWNPRDQYQSAERSKEYVRKSSLAWLVDCVDMYFRLINRLPRLLQNQELQDKFNDTNDSRSINARVKSLLEHYSINTIDSALFDLLICWRNRLVHFDAYNNILPSNKALLLTNKVEISSVHSGMDIERSLDSFEKKLVPTLKEVTTFVKSTIELLYIIDETLIANLDLIEYSDQVLIDYFSESTTKRIDNIFSKDEVRKHKAIRQILLQASFNNSEENEVDEFCRLIAALTCKKATSYIEQKSFRDVLNY
jgi:hypothetical protein